MLSYIRYLIGCLIGCFVLVIIFFIVVGSLILIYADDIVNWFKENIPSLSDIIQFLYDLLV